MSCNRFTLNGKPVCHNVVSARPNLSSLNQFTVHTVCKPAALELVAINSNEMTNTLETLHVEMKCHAHSRIGKVSVGQAQAQYMQ